MNGFEFIVQGMLNAIGMFIMMTVLSILSYLALKKWITKAGAELWINVKQEAKNILDGVTVEGKLKTKKTKKNNSECDVNNIPEYKA